MATGPQEKDRLLGGERRGVSRRRTRTRDALLEAARRLMAHPPREAFTIDDVVQGARVAKGSFYNHFPDKEALVAEVYRHIGEKEEAEVAAANREVVDPVARLAHGMTIYARLALVSPQEARILASSRLDALLSAASTGGLAKDLRAGLKAGRFVVPSVEAGAMLVVGQVAVLMNRLRGMAPRTAMPLAQQAVAITLIGLGLPHRDAHLIAAQAVDATMSELMRTSAENGSSSVQL